MGVPIVFVVEESPKAKFFVYAAIIFVTCGVVQLLVFVPKMIAVREEFKHDEEERARRKLYDSDVHGSDDSDDLNHPKAVTWNRNSVNLPKLSTIGMKSTNEL